MAVVIDPGHGGEDGGAVGKAGEGEVREKDLNLAIALALKEQLEARGIPVILTRQEDILLYDKNSDYKGHKKEQDLATRLKIGQEHPEAVFVSIHMNAFPQSQYHGLQVYYSPGDPRSATLATTIQGNTRATLQPDNRRAVKRAGSEIYLLHHLTTPAVLVECGFLSNPEECGRLNDPDYQAKLAGVLCDSIVEVFFSAG